MPTGLGDEVLWLSATNDNTGSSTAFDDQSGEGNDGTANGGTLVVADTSEGGTYAFDFDGSNDYINTGSTTVHQNNVFTYSFWINASASTSGTDGTAGSYESGGGVNSRGPLACSISGDNKLTFLYQSLGNSFNSAQRIDSVGDVYDSTWRHIACVFDGDSNEVRVYIDGTLDSSKTSSVPSTVNISTSLKFGTGSGGFTDGRMDDIRVFNRTLSQAEVTHLSSSRGIEGSPFSGLGDEELWLCPSLSDNANDISGNGNNGTYNGGMGTVADTGNGGSLAYDFDGSNDYINLGASTGIGQSSTFSLSIWAKADALASTAALISKYNRSNNRGFLLRMPSQPTWLTSSNLGNSSFNRTITSSQTVSTQTWYHIAATYDVATDAMELFIDGASVATGQSAGTITTTTVDMMIGRYESNEYNGRADDVRAYSRVLTAAEITHLASSRGVTGSPGTPTTGFYNPFISKTFNPNYVRRIG